MLLSILYDLFIQKQASEHAAKLRLLKQRQTRQRKNHHSVYARENVQSIEQETKQEIIYGRPLFEPKQTSREITTKRGAWNDSTQLLPNSPPPPLCDRCVQSPSARSKQSNVLHKKNLGNERVQRKARPLSAPKSSIARTRFETAAHPHPPLAQSIQDRLSGAAGAGLLLEGMWDPTYTATPHKTKSTGRRVKFRASVGETHFGESEKSKSTQMRPQSAKKSQNNDRIERHASSCSKIAQSKETSEKGLSRAWNARPNVDRVGNLNALALEKNATPADMK